MLLTGLTLLFVAAKLLGYIDWSWWLVLLPGIIKIVLMAFAVVVVFIGAALGKEIDVTKE